MSDLGIAGIADISPIIAPAKATTHPFSSSLCLW
jgi:hypothetical protein